MVHTLFESILGNKVLEERLQKATGRKAQRNRGNANALANNGMNVPTVQPTPGPPPPTKKAKYDDIDLGFSVGPPAPQMSYERSRPQTPAVTPSRELNPSNPNLLGSPPLQNDPLLPNRSLGVSGLHSRGPTRANSPFNGYSIPATPPDLFLVTRNSPNISQQLWENFQPDQLFPDGTIGDQHMFTSPTMQHAVDPQLQMHNQQMGGHSIPPMTMRQSSGNWNQGMGGMLGADMGPAMGDSDRWSNSSIGNAPVAPTHLNVEDWFQFFGINGEMNSIGVDAN